jgi:4'-phosphopantetheinyl transferase
MLIFEDRDSQNNYLLQIHKFVEGFHQTPESFLSELELRYFHQITNEKRKTEYLQSRFTLKEWLSQRTSLLPKDIHFQNVGEGKPVLTTSSVKLDFNLSHSGEFFALAFSEKGQVGVDIEKIRAPQHLAQIAKKFFSAKEVLLIENEQNLQRQSEIFSKFWSGKEALIKAVGGGVFKNVHEVEIDSQSWCVKRLPQDFGNLSHWQLRFFENIEGYTCSVAFKSFA